MQMSHPAFLVPLPAPFHSSTRPSASSPLRAPRALPTRPLPRASPVRALPRASAALDASDPHAVDAAFASQSPTALIKYALTRFGPDVAISFSGAEDVLLIEYARRTKLPFRVFTLDTGRLHPETYTFLSDVEKHYNIRIEYTFPDAVAVQNLVNAKGLFSFYTDGHTECCGIRKVAPLRKKLSTLRAWITGQRKDQSPGTRTAVPLVQFDPTFTSSNSGEPLWKFNPLANTSSDEVWFAIRGNDVPYNKLHERGFKSIGCEPCTRAILPSQHEREGRWWWEEATKKECGLHAGNVEEK